MRSGKGEPLLCAPVGMDGAAVGRSAVTAAVKVSQSGRVCVHGVREWRQVEETSPKMPQSGRTFTVEAGEWQPVEVPSPKMLQCGGACTVMAEKWQPVEVPLPKMSQGGRMCTAVAEECHPVAKPLAEEHPPAAEPASFPHEGLAAACARRFAGRGIPMEELLQEARAALLMAEQRFDPARGLRFSTYAVPVVLGALKACCRRAAPMHIPRGEGRLLARWYGSDTEKEEARSRDPRLCACLAAAERMRQMTADPDLAALAREDGFEERVLLRQAVRSLGSPHAQVIALRYLLGLTQREVGERLGAAQWQICRWERQGLERLRAGWAGE